MKSVIIHALKAVQVLNKETCGKNKGKTVIKSKVAEEIGISTDYLEQITRVLISAGIVGSVQGCRGGMLLNRTNSMCVSVAEVYSLWEDGGKLPEDLVAHGLICDALSISVREFFKMAENVK